MALTDVDRLPPKVAVTCHMPEKLADSLFYVARGMGISRSELIRRLCEDYVSGQPTPTHTTGAPAA